MFRFLVALLVAVVSAQRQEFPESWGEPPMMQTMDYRPLPGGYGHGSSTLSAWILEQMAKEREKTGHGTRPAPGDSGGPGQNWPPAPRTPPRERGVGSPAHPPHLPLPPPSACAVSYPPAFGEPPRAMTRDLRRLPYGYGMGSSTLANWLSRKAEDVYQETVDEYSNFE